MANKLCSNLKEALFQYRNRASFAKQIKKLYIFKAFEDKIIVSIKKLFIHYFEKGATNMVELQLGFFAFLFIAVSFLLLHILHGLGMM